MILSFSEASMQPYIRAGICQALGEDVGAARVKRQTIRKLGPRGRQLLDWDSIGGSIPYDLHLWWKSRTSERQVLGVIPCAQVRVFQIDIWHASITPPDGPAYPCVRIDGRRGWRDGDAVLFWSPGDKPNGFSEEALKDGFESPEALRDYFVPNMGDRFEAILFKW